MVYKIKFPEFMMLKQKPKSLLKKDIYKLLPKRKIDANKGDFGHVLIVGGDYGMGGAVIMAAEAAYKSGAGRVTVLTREENILPLLSRLPCAMTARCDNFKELPLILENKTAVILGPGLGQGQGGGMGSMSDWSQTLFDFFMNSKLPKVVDADALNLLSKSQKKFRLQNAVLTPHPGEASRLLKTSIEEIQQDRNLSIRKLYDQYQSNIVLKGNGSLILGEDRELYICPYGNPGMAVAGMGDILSGIIGAFLAQNLSPKTAALLGVTIHALAGDLAEKTQGQIGILPTDLINYIPKIINQKI